MTTLQYESLPQRPPRASRRHKPAPAVSSEEGKEKSAGRPGSDVEMVPAQATTRVYASADRPPSSSPKDAAAAAAAAPVTAAVTPRGPLDDSRAKRAREEEREEDEQDDGMEREQQADVAGGVGGNGGNCCNGKENPASTSTSASTFSRTQAVAGFDFEYLDHTADIQIHSCEDLFWIDVGGWGGHERTNARKALYFSLFFAHTTLERTKNQKTKKNFTGGASLEAAFCSAGLGMVNYMTPLEGLAAVEER